MFSFKNIDFRSHYHFRGVSLLKELCNGVVSTESMTRSPKGETSADNLQVTDIFAHPNHIIVVLSRFRFLTIDAVQQAMRQNDITAADIGKEMFETAKSDFWRNNMLISRWHSNPIVLVMIRKMHPGHRQMISVQSNGTLLVWQWHKDEGCWLHKSTVMEYSLLDSANGEAVVISVKYIAEKDTFVWIERFRDEQTGQYRYIIRKRELEFIDAASLITAGVLRSSTPAVTVCVNLDPPEVFLTQYSIWIYADGYSLTEFSWDGERQRVLLVENDDKTALNREKNHFEGIELHKINAPLGICEYRETNDLIMLDKKGSLYVVSSKRDKKFELKRVCGINLSELVEEESTLDLIDNEKSMEPPVTDIFASKLVLHVMLDDDIYLYDMFSGSQLQQLPVPEGKTILWKSDDEYGMWGKKGVCKLVSPPILDYIISIPKTRNISRADANRNASTLSSAWGMDFWSAKYSLEELMSREIHDSSIPSDGAGKTHYEVPNSLMDKLESPALLLGAAISPTEVKFQKRAAEKYIRDYMNDRTADITGLTESEKAAYIKRTLDRETRLARKLEPLFSQYLSLSDQCEKASLPEEANAHAYDPKVAGKSLSETKASLLAAVPTLLAGDASIEDILCIPPGDLEILCHNLPEVMLELLEKHLLLEQDGDPQAKTEFKVHSAISEKKNVFLFQVMCRLYFSIKPNLLEKFVSGCEYASEESENIAETTRSQNANKEPLRNYYSTALFSLPPLRRLASDGGGEAQNVDTLDIRYKQQMQAIKTLMDISCMPNTAHNFVLRNLPDEALPLIEGTSESDMDDEEFVERCIFALTMSLANSSLNDQIPHILSKISSSRYVDVNFLLHVIKLILPANPAETPGAVFAANGEPPVDMFARSLIELFSLKEKTYL